jgi:hypothetical protein
LQGFAAESVGQALVRKDEEFGGSLLNVESLAVKKQPHL